jgi:DnaK suppressor protein
MPSNSEAIRHDEPPTIAERAHLREELEQRLAKLLGRRLAGQPVHAINPEDNKNEADQVARLMEQNAAISLCNQTTHQLREIRAALARMNAGTYGRCSNCGEEIGRRRLTANPSAELCLRCQNRADLGQWLSFSSPRDSLHVLRSA